MKISKEKFKNIENVIKEKLGDHSYEVINLAEFEIEYSKQRDEDNNKIVSGIVSDDINHFIEYLETLSQENLGKLKNLLKFLV